MTLKDLDSLPKKTQTKNTFVHISGLIDEIREGDYVEFDLQEGKKD